MPRSNKSDYKVLSVEIRKDKVEELDSIALTLGASRSEILRIALNRYLPILKEENKHLFELDGQITEINQ